MSKHRFFIDQVIRVTERHHYEIEAPTYDEALKIVEREFDVIQCDPANGHIKTEILYPTITELEPEDYDGDSTRELFNADTTECLWINVPPDDLDELVEQGEAVVIGGNSSNDLP